jgi:hypothetical protein
MFDSSGSRSVLVRPGSAARPPADWPAFDAFNMAQTPPAGFQSGARRFCRERHAVSKVDADAMHCVITGRDRVGARQSAISADLSGSSDRTGCKVRDRDRIAGGMETFARPPGTVLARLTCGRSPLE